MKNVKITLAAATCLAVASVGFASLLTTPPATNGADCPSGWNWNNESQNCVPPGLPKDPPDGCLTSDGNHINGKICVK